MPADPLRDAPPLLTADAMRRADAYTIETFGVPSFTLMESAGRAATETLAQAYGPVAGRTVAVYCGKGNNGGDGLVVARQLATQGAAVRVVLLGAPDALSQDAGRNLALLRRLAEQDDNARLGIHPFENLPQVSAFRPADLHVDALLGTGLTNEVRAPMRGLVEWINAQPQPTLALDVPTGLHSDTGAVLGTAVRADLTVTMGARKAGLVLGDGPPHAGRVVTAEIGIPRHALERDLPAPGCARYPDDEVVRALLPRRAPDAHKYTAGMALVVGGSPGMTGAPVMSSRAAARVGAGYVACATPADAQPTLALKLTEIPTVALPADPDGLHPDAAIAALDAWLGKAHALLVGPGLGRATGTQAFVRRLLETTDRPAVVDADGLNALDPDWLTARGNGRWVLTPHAGEFGRLAGTEAGLADRIATAQAAAARWNSILVLKGMPSVAAAPDGRACVGRTGGAALATAGTGDVLAGLCTGLLAQGLAPFDAAVAALHLGGAAADRYAAHRAPQSLQATDLIEQLPLLLHERFASLP